MTPRAGTKIGNYILIAPLQKGGTAHLWKARHMLSNKIVAIKILNEDANLQRVRNEARLQSAVLHPNIVSIYEFIWLENRPCIAMELVNGLALNDYVQQRRPSEKELIHLAEQLLNAIHFLHEKKIIHRDLKPENIMVQKDGVLKILDFGIAKGWSSPNITREGMAIGTPEYMAPERFEGSQSVQSDIWAIGLILYEMKSGKSFFPSFKNTAERNTFFRKPYIGASLEKLSMPWKKIIGNCLKLNPKHRYKSVANISQALSPTSGSHANNWPSTDLTKFLKPALIGGGLLVAAFVGSQFLNFGKTPCEGVSISYQLHPNTAILNTSRGEVLDKGNWQLCGDPGSSIQITITAEGYIRKSFRYTFPKLNDNLTYVLEKK